MRLRRLGLVALVFCLFAGGASAASFSFTGMFTQDDQLQIFLFTAPTANVTLRTWSYAGGTGVGGSVLAGGFDPVLTLFDATGGLSASSTFVDSNNDDVTSTVLPDPVHGFAFDSLLLLTGLDIGKTYALVLTENDNLFSGLTFGDGFSQAGKGNFTPGEFGCGDTAPFCQGPFQPNLDGHWAVDIVGVGDATAVGTPEPASMLLLAAGLGTLALLRRHGKQA